MINPSIYITVFEQPFKIFDKNVLTQILSKMDPKSVLSACQTDVKFSQICNDQDVFKTLISIQYPGIPIDYNNPKLQYIKITGDIPSEYCIFWEGQGNILIDNQKNEIDLIDKFIPVGFLCDEDESDDYHEVRNEDYKVNGYTGTYMKRSFNIFGTKIRNKIWLRIYLTHSYDGPEIEIKAFDSKKEAIDNFFTNDMWNNIIRHVFGRNADEYIKRLEYNRQLSLSQLLELNKETLKELKYPVPFTLDGIIKYVNDNDFFKLNPNESETENYMPSVYFIEVELKN